MLTLMIKVKRWSHEHAFKVGEISVRQYAKKEKKRKEGKTRKDSLRNRKLRKL